MKACHECMELLTRSSRFSRRSRIRHQYQFSGCAWLGQCGRTNQVASECDLQQILKRGETLPLSHVIHHATKRNAKLFGFINRGLLAPGMKAELSAIDYNNIGLGELKILRDLHAGGTRIMRGARTSRDHVNGVLTRLNDEDTGSRPGRLFRSGS